MQADGSARLGHLKHHVVELLAAGRGQEACDAVLAARLRFPRQQALVAAWAAETLCRLGEADLAVGVLAEAMDRGAWWWEGILRANPPLGPIQGRADFKEIVQRAERARPNAARTRPPIVYSPSARPVGVLLPLHGRSDHHITFARRWEAARDAGFLVVVPASSDATTSDGDLGWIDEDRARTEVRRIYAALAYSYRRLPLVLAGYSQGARIAAEWALTGVIAAAAGFAVVCLPADRVPDARGAPETTRGYLFTGEHDDDRQAAERFTEHLTEEGLAVRLDVMAGVGHAYPPDFATRLPAALSFVLGEGRPARELPDHRVEPAVPEGAQ
jgi:predicted esterase